MRNLTLKATLSALLVSVPLAGAFAESGTFGGNPNVDQFYTSNVDQLYTSSIGAAATTSLARQLDTALRAAETNLQAGGRDNGVSPALAAQLGSEITAIRQAAAQERQANGGELSAASYRTLSERVQAVQQRAYAR